MSDRLLLKLFLDLVRIPSPSGSEQEIATYVSRYLSGLSIKNQFDSFGNLIAFLPGTKPSRLFTAHLDTVTPCHNIRPQIRNGSITSDGSTILGADNKASLAAILFAITRLSPPHSSLELVFTRSEEVGNLGAVNLDYSLLASEFGYSFDYGGSLGTIFTASPFYLRFDIDFFGRSAHAGNPAQAINVLPQIADFVSSLPLGQPLPDTTLNIGLLSAGSTRNTVPGSGHIAGEIRSFSQSHLQDICSLIQSRLPQSSKFASYLENAGYSIDPLHPALLQARKAISQAGLHPKLVSTQACFDANIFIPNGITVINMSDGSLYNHTCRESITVKNLRLLARIIHLLMLD